MAARGRCFGGLPWCLLILVMAADSYLGGHPALGASLSRQRLEVRRHLKRFNKPAVKSIKSPDGDIIDCVHVSHQPAFDHPFLKNHTVQMRPNFHPEGLLGENKVRTDSGQQQRSSMAQLWHLNGRCPEGTIPIRRTKREDILRASSVRRYGRKKHRAIPKPSSADLDLINDSGHQVYILGHRQICIFCASHDPHSSGFLIPVEQHAIAYVEGNKYYGVKATINVWNISKIQQPNEFSLSQLWILGGSFGEDLNSIEAGWHVSVCSTPT